VHAVRLAVGEDTTVIATLHDRNGNVIPNAPSRFQVTWPSSDATVATVDNGVVRAVGEGRATVSAAAALLPAATVDVEVEAPPVSAPSYQAMALSAPGTAQSNGWAINNGGVVVGWWNVSGGRAFRWSEADGVSGLPGISSSRGINDAGAIAGWANHTSGTTADGWTAYVFQDGVRTDLAALEAGSNSGAHSGAQRINDAGTVVGTSDPGARAVVWKRGADGSYGAPVALRFSNRNDRPIVNGRGDIAFTAFAPSSAALYEPVLWRAQPDGSYADALFLGRPAGGSYFVQDINDAGLVVGFRWTGAKEMAVLWHPDDYSEPIDLGVGQAWGINSHGLIVGVTGGELPTFGGLPRRPALWLVDALGTVTGPFDIGTPAGFEFGGARAISDNGWITGSAW
jgi:uncharacterized membrane protein